MKEVNWTVTIRRKGFWIAEIDVRVNLYSDDSFMSIEVSGNEDGKPLDTRWVSLEEKDPLYSIFEEALRADQEFWNAADEREAA